MLRRRGREGAVKVKCLRLFLRPTKAKLPINYGKMHDTTVAQLGAKESNSIGCRVLSEVSQGVFCLFSFSLGVFAWFAVPT